MTEPRLFGQLSDGTVHIINCDGDLSYRKITKDDMPFQNGDIMLLTWMNGAVCKYYNGLWIGIPKRNVVWTNLKDPEEKEAQDVSINRQRQDGTVRHGKGT